MPKKLTVLALVAAFIGGYEIGDHVHKAPIVRPVVRRVVVIHPTCAGDHDGDCNEPDNDGNR